MGQSLKAEGKQGVPRMKFTELVRLLESHGIALIRHKGAVRYYGKCGIPRLIRVDHHGSKEVPTGTCHFRSLGDFGSLSAVDVHVTHQWPPDFTPPPAGRWVVIQPWA
jgi:predicted RNA binding protein YcfA (HicA-like mRNA interferase family)